MVKNDKSCIKENKFVFSYSSGGVNVQTVGESGVSVLYERVKLYPSCKSVGENTDWKNGHVLTL